MSGRILKYREAISEGLCQAMERDPSIFVTGIGIDYSAGIFGTTLEAKKRFPDRVFESPAMENALTGIAIGAAAMGKRPLIVHARNDFMFLALDQLLNLAAKWKYMYGGKAGSVPIVVRAIVGKGWGQGATHSQSLHSLLAHFPGLRVGVPSSPSAAKGMLCAALSGDVPTVLIEHRALYEIEEEVFPDYYESSCEGIGGIVGGGGGDVTIVATSLMMHEAKKAFDVLLDHGIQTEIIDPGWLRPLCEEAILDSVARTGRLIIADGSWETCGFASEVAALVAEKAFDALKAPVKRITWPDCPCPVSVELEKQFYPTAQTIVDAALQMLAGETPLRSKPAIRAALVEGMFAAAPDFTGPY